LVTRWSRFFPFQFIFHSSSQGNQGTLAPFTFSGMNLFGHARPPSHPFPLFRCATPGSPRERCGWGLDVRLTAFLTLRFFLSCPPHFPPWSIVPLVSLAFGFPRGRLEVSLPVPPSLFAEVKGNRAHVEGSEPLRTIYFPVPHLTGAFAANLSPSVPDAVLPWRFCVEVSKIRVVSPLSPLDV